MGKAAEDIGVDNHPNPGKCPFQIFLGHQSRRHSRPSKRVWIGRYLTAQVRLGRSRNDVDGLSLHATLRRVSLDRLRRSVAVTGLAMLDLKVAQNVAPVAEDQSVTGVGEQPEMAAGQCRGEAVGL